jgi:peptidyl-prolyl cis-trans isomerase C
MPKAQLRAPLLDQLIDRRLASLAAEKQGLAADPRVMRELAQAREDVMQGAYLRAYTAQRITDAAVRARYQAQLKAFKPEPQVRARHILAKDEAAIRGAAERLKKGEAFEAVAKQISVDGSASEGGELGTFTADKMVPEFSEVAFKLGAGQVSQPFKSRFGWHIVQVEDKGMTKAPPFAALEKELKSQMAGEMVESALAALRKSAKIERTADAPKAPATH